MTSVSNKYKLQLASCLFLFDLAKRVIHNNAEIKTESYKIDYSHVQNNVSMYNVPIFHLDHWLRTSLPLAKPQPVGHASLF